MCIRRILSVLALALFAHPAVADCSVRYAFAPAPGLSTAQTITIAEGERADIHQGDMLYIRNQGANPIRIQRTGPGGSLDLEPEGQDPRVGQFLVSIILQTIECLPADAMPDTPIEQLVQQAFENVTGATVQFLNQLDGWRTQAEQWGEQTAQDWGSCPSPGAQQSYNQLRTWRNNVEASLQQAEQVRAQAEQARTNCMQATNNAPLCSTTFNELPVQGWIAQLTATRTSLTASMQAMRALRCVDGCDQTVSLSVPNPRVRSGGFFELTAPGMVDVDVCTRMDMGEIGFNTQAVAAGNVGQVVEAEAPSCTRTETLSVCTDWDVDALLPRLQRLRVVPPRTPEISLTVPTRQLEVVSGIQQARCRRPLQVCEPSGEVTLTFNQGEDLFQDGVLQCERRVTVACQDPPFGLVPQTQRIEVPDPTRARIGWRGGTRGGIEVDLTRPELRVACRGQDRTLRIPRPPQISVQSRLVELPFLCTRPSLRPVVANP